MICFPKYEKIIYLLFITNALINLSKQTKNFSIGIPFDNSDLDISIIEYNDKQNNCSKWIPSLFNPMILIINPKFEEIDRIELISDVYIPTLSLKSRDLSISIFNRTFLGYYHNVIFGIMYFIPQDFTKYKNNCYFGLSLKEGGFKINNSYILLDILKKENEITQKIFSFDKWIINYDIGTINTTFYFGYEHEHFNSKNKDRDAIIGKCKVKEDYDYWGCHFDYMELNNKKMNLTNKNDEPYKIYFSTENYDIIFPETFFDSFNITTEGKCSYNSEHEESEDFYVSCNNFFNENNSFPVNLISDNMNITIEIDNKKRFSKGNDDKINKSRIKFENVNYFILPLIMFKNFHVQFDGENNEIKFYTNDKNILHIKKENNKKSSSKVGTVFLIIFIIILIAAIGFGILFLIRKRKGSVEKNINKYNKFDEDENFQNMNEKRVF